MMSALKSWLLIACAAAVAAAPPPAAARSDAAAADPWFPQLGDNLTRITWAHAVNDRAFLLSALDSDVLMLEADIVQGHVRGAESAPATPVMAHPPAVLSDLSLADFLAAVADHNRRRPDSRKGVKLDFKSIEAFEASESLVAPIAGEDMEYPVWLNADILPGPVAASATPVDAERFLRLAGSFPRATLSVGWTTRYGGDTGVAEGAYSAQETGAMLSALRAHAVAQPVTFPVRAGLAAGEGGARALRALLADAQALLGASGRATLTVWSSEGDAVRVGALRELMLGTGLDRVYLDVPEDLAAQLHLDSAARAASAPAS